MNKYLKEEEKNIHFKPFPSENFFVLNHLALEGRYPNFTSSTTKTKTFLYMCVFPQSLAKNYCKFYFCGSCLGCSLKWHFMINSIVERSFGQITLKFKIANK